MLMQVCALSGHSILSWLFSCHTSALKLDVQSVTLMFITWTPSSGPPCHPPAAVHMLRFHPQLIPAICQPCAAEWGLICCIWQLTSVTKCPNICYWLFPQGNCHWWTGGGNNVGANQPPPPPTASGHTAWLVSQSGARTKWASRQLPLDLLSIHN